MWPQRSAWLGLVNPTRTPQQIDIEVFGTPSVTKTVTIPPRARDAFELGVWGARGGFGVEVRCGSTCAASLVMWDPEFRIPNTSVPVVACEAR